MVVDTLSRLLHLVFAGLWAGSVVYVALAVLPLARDGAFNTTKPLEVLSSRLTTLSRVSALVLFLTGSHLAAAIYTVDGDGGPGLFTSLEGQLVIVMIVLWVALAGLVEIGAKRFESGLNGKKLREPAHQALPFFRAAAVVAVLLLVIGGLITSGGLHAF